MRVRELIRARAYVLDVVLVLVLGLTAARVSEYARSEVRVRACGQIGSLIG